MGEPAKKLEKLPEPSAPDGMRPVALEYYYLPYNIGATVNHAISVGSILSDGHKVTGLVREITQYPGGFVIASIECGRLPGRLESEQKTEIKYLTFSGGHGMVKQ